jgi:hypothetical protein
LNINSLFLAPLDFRSYYWNNLMIVDNEEYL